METYHPPAGDEASTVRHPGMLTECVDPVCREAAELLRPVSQGTEDSPAQPFKSPGGIESLDAVLAVPHPDTAEAARLRTEVSGLVEQRDEAVRECREQKHGTRVNEVELLGQLADLRARLARAVVLPEDWRAQFEANWLESVQLLESWIEDARGVATQPAEPTGADFASRVTANSLAALRSKPGMPSRDEVVAEFAATWDGVDRTPQPAEPVVGVDVESPFCGDPGCVPCRADGRSCDEYMGDEETAPWCPRCGWHERRHPVDLADEDVPDSAFVAPPDPDHPAWTAPVERVRHPAPAAQPEPQGEPHLFQRRDLVGRLGHEKKRGHVMEVLGNGRVRVRWEDSPYPQVLNPEELILFGAWRDSDSKEESE